MHQSLFFVAYIYLFISSPQQRDEVGTIVFPILQMGKLKQREMKSVYTESKWQSQNSIQTIWLQRAGISQYLEDMFTLL